MTLSITLTSALATLNRLASHPLAPWLKRVAEDEKAKVEQRITETKRNPDGRGWAPWQPSTESARIRKGNAPQGLLYDEGLLLAGFVAGSTPDSAFITNVVEHAEYMQNGVSGHVVARPFLGWGKDSLALLELDAAIELARIR